MACTPDRRRRRSGSSRPSRPRSRERASRTARRRRVRASRTTWWPRSTDRARARCELEPAADGRLRRARAHRGGRPPVLPDDRAVQRAARRPVPSDSGLSLIGYADRGRVERPRGQLRAAARPGLSRRASRSRSASCSTSPGSGEVLGQLPVRDVDDLPVLVDGERTHSGGAGIDRDHDGHGGTVVRAASGAQRRLRRSTLRSVSKCKPSRAAADQGRRRVLSVDRDVTTVL